MEYQDFVTDVLYKNGFPICAYSSKKYNLKKGESTAHTEIKFDSKCTDTGNLYIETHERKNKGYAWVKSGINRNDNSIFYFTGNYKKAWWFVKEQLKYLCEKKNKNGEFIFKRVQTPTSKGILLPINYLEKHSLIPVKIFDFEKKGDIKKENKTRTTTTKS